MYPAPSRRPKMLATRSRLIPRNAAATRASVPAVACLPAKAGTTTLPMTPPTTYEFAMISNPNRLLPTTPMVNRRGSSRIACPSTRSPRPSTSRLALLPLNVPPDL
jgi:hypothetical protein